MCTPAPAQLSICSLTSSNFWCEIWYGCSFLMDSRSTTNINCFRWQVNPSQAGSWPSSLLSSALSSFLEPTWHLVILTKCSWTSYNSNQPVIGQSSSVIDDQNTQMDTTASNVNKVSKKAPLIFPLVGLQICTETTYWKIWPIANSSAAATR